MIIRSKREPERPYFSTERATAQDKDLSLEALGVLTYLLSKPDNWLPSASDIARRSKWGKQKVYKILNELLERGYLVRRQERANGKCARWILDVFESSVSLPGFQEVEKQEVEKQEVEKQPTKYNREYIKQNTQRKQNTHTTEAPDGAGGVVSIYALQICQQYAQHLHDSGQGIDKPGGFARAIYSGKLAGEHDADITAWLAARAQLERKKLHDDPHCPRCQGCGWEFVGGAIGMQRCSRWAAAAG